MLFYFFFILKRQQRGRKFEIISCAKLEIHYARSWKLSSAKLKYQFRESENVGGEGREVIGKNQYDLYYPKKNLVSPNYISKKKEQFVYNDYILI